MRKNYRYYVKTTQDDFGGIETELLTGRQARIVEYNAGDFYIKDNEDIYIDGFDSIEEANAFIQKTERGQEVY